MQLDRTRIVIRERNAMDLLDLSLRVMRIYIVPIMAAAGIVIIPLALVNEFLLRQLVADELSQYTIPQYIVAMSQLVYLEAPVATAADTVFLGRMMFLQETDLRSIVGEIWALRGRLFWTQFVLRGVVAAFVIGFISLGEPDFINLLWIVVVVVGLLRMARPFINEIVLLERNPLQSRDEAKITIGRRSSRLHGPSSGDLFARSMLVMPVLMTVVASVAFTFWFVQGLLTNVWLWGHVMTRVFIPLSMWIVAIYASVLRFLNYLDLRIRREGWEVELRVRAAASEMRGVQV